MVIHAVLTGCPAAESISSVTPDLVVRLKLPAFQLCKRGSLTRIQLSSKCMQHRPILGKQASMQIWQQKGLWSVYLRCRQYRSASTIKSFLKLSVNGCQ